jgi:hypothetical protein
MKSAVVNGDSRNRAEEEERATSLAKYFLQVYCTAFRLGF